MLLFCFCSFIATAQDEPEKLDLPGDNLNLYAVMKLFQESPTLEEFEKKLNDESTKINNLDLDGDDNIDYIKVVDNLDGEVHNISLKVAVSKNEDQDVAVFVVQKDKDGQVQIQLIGDEDLYGRDYIIEPNMEGNDNNGGTANPGYTGNTRDIDGNPVVIERTTTYQIATWPVIHFIFVPGYVVWRSPWYWGNYPPYWRPWKPFFWHYYYGYHYHWNYFYYGHYRYSHVYQYPNWRERYYGGSFRSRSAFVQVRYQRGDYRNTYARPQLAREGAEVFRRDHPKAPSVNNRLPNFDNNGRPVVTRPISRPGNANNFPQRPATKPVITRPGDGNNNLPGRPANRPGFNKPPAATPAPITRPPVTRPITRPAKRDNIPQRPVTRPVSPKHEKPVDNRPTRDKQKN